MFQFVRNMMSGGSRDPTDDFWYTPIGEHSSAGMRVTADTAMQIAVVYACVRLISETAGQLPLQVFQRQPNGDKEPATDHALYEILHDTPNDEHTAIEFREMMTAWAVMRGTAFAEIVPGPRASVGQLVPLHPDHMRCIKVEDASGRVQWQFEHKEPGTPPRRLLRDELFVLRAMATDKACPVLGLDPLTVQRDTLGAAIAAHDYGSRFFQNDARPGGIIEHPSYFKDEDSRNAFRRAWQAAFGGANRHKTAVLEHGAKYHSISVTPEQAQFLETRRFNAEETARIYRVPLHKIGMLDRATFSNIEHQSIEFVVDTMMPWLVRWEQSIKRDLMLGEGFIAQHNVAGLLRGDTKSRFDAYAVARNWGWLSVNEIRRMENLNSIGDEGDVYLQPLNMVDSANPEPQPQPEPAAQPLPDSAAGDPLIITATSNTATRSRVNGERHE